MKRRSLSPALRLGATAAAALALLPALAAAPPPAASTNPVPALADLGQALLREAQPANAVVSPVATAVALAMVQAGANGPAEHEIEALFGPGRSGAQALRHGLPELTRQVLGEEASPVRMATRMWVDSAAQVPAAYGKRLAQRWRADAQRVSFAQSETTRGQINAWTAEHTAGRVKDLLPAGSLTAATQMALTAAIHFKSPWERPFDAEKTEPRPFKTAAGETKPVPTMVDERGVLQAQVDGHLVMELPFAKGYALLVAVPAEGSTAAAGGAPFGGEQLARWRAALKPLKCELALPKFSIAPQAGSLKATLQGLGVKTVFTEGADLRPMLGRGAHQMHLDDVYQAAGITVDEQGGEAVAAAAATVRSKSLAIPVPPCAVDRAFSFALLHQATGTPLFVGRVGDPARTE
jgi:serpin B